MSPSQRSSRSRRVSNDKRVTDSSIFTKILNGLRKGVTGWLAIIFVIFTATGSIEPVHQPFFCNDQSIRREFGGDTVPILTFILTALFVPPIIMGVSEAVHEGMLLEQTKRRRFLKRWGCWSGDYLLGFSYVLFLIELAKTLMGELRPHFIDTCKPDWTKINCSAGIVTDYICTGKGPDWLVKRDIYKSFPSGHAALSFYAFVFTSMYSQVRIPRSQYSHLFRSWIQLLGLSFALISSLTRITDNRHHWWDVMAGTILGIAGAYFTVHLIVQNNFLPKKEEDRAESETILAPLKINNDKMTSL